jgi:hypothetical protein
MVRRQFLSTATTQQQYGEQTVSSNCNNTTVLWCLVCSQFISTARAQQQYAVQCSVSSQAQQQHNSNMVYSVQSVLKDCSNTTALCCTEYRRFLKSTTAQQQYGVQNADVCFVQQQHNSIMSYSVQSVSMHCNNTTALWCTVCTQFLSTATTQQHYDVQCAVTATAKQQYGVQCAVSS